MKKYIAPEALNVAFNTESRFALTLSEWETGANGMQSNQRFRIDPAFEDLEWDDEDEE